MITQPDIDLGDRYDFMPMNFADDRPDPYNMPWDESEVTLRPSRSSVNCDVEEIMLAVQQRLETEDE